MYYLVNFINWKFQLSKSILHSLKKCVKKFQITHFVIASGENYHLGFLLCSISFDIPRYCILYTVYSIQYRVYILLEAPKIKSYLITEDGYLTIFSLNIKNLIYVYFKESY